MSTTSPSDDPVNDDPVNDDRMSAPTEDHLGEPGADRPPTAEEEAVADRVVEDVDLERVARHEQEAMRTGATIRGEGQIEPDTD